MGTLRDIVPIALAGVVLAVGAATALDAAGANAELSAAVLIIVAAVIGGAAGVAAIREPAARRRR